LHSIACLRTKTINFTAKSFCFETYVPYINEQKRRSILDYSIWGFNLCSDTVTAQICYSTAVRVGISLIVWDSCCGPLGCCVLGFRFQVNLLYLSSNCSGSVHVDWNKHALAIIASVTTWTWLELKLHVSEAIKSGGYSITKLLNDRITKECDASAPQQLNAFSEMNVSLRKCRLMSSGPHYLRIILKLTICLQENFP